LISTRITKQLHLFMDHLKFLRLDFH
jgi:hypothetical protein